MAQAPQNVTVGKGKDESIWESSTALMIVVLILFIMIVTRTWSKRIHKKRDDLANIEKSKKEDVEPGESGEDPQ